MGVPPWIPGRGEKRVREEGEMLATRDIFTFQTGHS